MSDSVVIRGAAAEEAALLSDLAFRSKAIWGYTPEFMELCRNELVVERDQIVAHEASHAVCEVNGGVVGFYQLQQTTPVEFELGALFVDPNHIGNG